MRHTVRDLNTRGWKKTAFKTKKDLPGKKKDLKNSEEKLKKEEE